jgi:hypothetical protein
MGNISDFERGQIIDVHLAGASVTKTAALLGVSTVTVGYVGIRKSWEDNVSEEKQWAKIKTDRKRSSYTNKDCLEKSQNYCSTGDSRTVCSS